MFKLCKEDRLRREQMRGNYPEGSRWYGVMTHWGQENRLRGEIESSFGADVLDEVLLPDLIESTRGGKKVTRRLFGGYVFLRCRMNDDLYMQVAGYPQVVQVLGRGYRIPMAIDDLEMERLKNLLEFRPAPQVVARAQVGQKVKVIDGLLRGTVGRVLQSNSEHVKLELSFSFLGLDSGIAVTVPHSSVQFLTSSKASDSQIRRRLAPIRSEGVASA